jgi:hypothetical protein
MTDYSTDTVRGLTVTDHGDGSYTVHRSGTATDSAFAAWLGSMTEHEQVGVLVRTLVEGRRGGQGEYRPVAVTSIRFRPETLNVSRVWMGPFDGGTPQPDSNWS